MPGPIVLLTDFGSSDWFAGAMKGVIAGLAPAATVLDLTHGVPRGDIRAGAFNLWAARDAFPRGAVFVAVVDPGVGSDRRALLVEAHGRRFVGPDNGLLSWAAAGDPGRAIRALENPRYRLPDVSASFHGRDVFAPAAAHLARGTRPAAFGPRLGSMAELPPLEARLEGRALRGEVVHVDAYGNAITSIRFGDLRGLGRPPAAAVAGRRRFPLKRFYAEVPEGEPLCLIGSTGLLELSVNGGRSGLRAGAKVTLA